MSLRTLVCSSSGAVLLCLASLAGHASGRLHAPPTPLLISFPYIVNSTSDAGNDNRNSTVCDDGTGHCTLRGAIQAANNQAGADVINIALAAALARPTVSGPAQLIHDGALAETDAFYRARLLR